MAGDSTTPQEATGLGGFARFFKKYMSASTYLVAALPIPVTSFDVIPTFAFQRKALAVYTSLFCFLLLAFIFFNRHGLARLLFPEETVLAKTASGPSFHQTFLAFCRIAVRLLPLVLVLGALASVYLYHSTLESALEGKFPEVRVMWERQGIEHEQARLVSTGMTPNDAWEKAVKTAPEEDMPREFILDNAGSHPIPDASRLALYYLLIFLCAEAAFILMATKEYLQDLLGLKDRDLIEGHGGVTAKASDVGPTAM